MSGCEGSNCLGQTCFKAPNGCQQDRRDCAGHRDGLGRGGHWQDHSSASHSGREHRHGSGSGPWQLHGFAAGAEVNQPPRYCKQCPNWQRFGLALLYAKSVTRCAYVTRTSTVRPRDRAAASIWSSLLACRRSNSRSTCGTCQPRRRASSALRMPCRAWAGCSACRLETPSSANPCQAEMTRLVAPASSSIASSCCIEQ